MRNFIGCEDSDLSGDDSCIEMGAHSCSRDTVTLYKEKVTKEANSNFKTCSTEVTGY